MLGCFAWPAQAHAPADRYQINDTTVLDKKTHLLWQRTVPPTRHVWRDAQSYCQGLNLDGHSGWRLPNIKELQTLVDRRTVKPAIDVTAFPNSPWEKPDDWFWSATPGADGPDVAWVTSFAKGENGIGWVSYAYWVRCVH